MITDDKYCAFLDKLAADVRGKNGLVLSQWESDFVGTYIGLPTNAFFFTPARRSAIDRMWRRYGRELDFPHPLDPAQHRPKLAEADADGCQYLVRDEGRQQPCNAPATCREPGKLRYCAMHGEAVRVAMKRQGKTIALVNI